MLLIALLVSAQVPAWLFVASLMRSHQRCYEYAASQANRYNIMDPAGRAYSDMATVIALDGKAPERSLIT